MNCYATVFRFNWTMYLFINGRWCGLLCKDVSDIDKSFFVDPRTVVLFSQTTLCSLYKSPRPGRRPHYEPICRPITAQSRQPYSPEDALVARVGALSSLLHYGGNSIPSHPVCLAREKCRPADYRNFYSYAIIIKDFNRSPASMTLKRNYF